MRRLLPVIAVLMVLAAAGAFIALAPSSDALPPCPCDTSTTYNTPGSTATGSTCNEARTTLSNQEKAKIYCAAGQGYCNPVFVYNQCTWNGTEYAITGWWEYNCRTGCYEGPPEP